MSAAAIITARGGSKRIPRKNIRDFCGKPMIAYSIEAALESGIFDEVMVSTDSMEIADVAKEYGASVPFLRSEQAAIMPQLRTSCWKYCQNMKSWDESFHIWRVFIQRLFSLRQRSLGMRFNCS